MAEKPFFSAPCRRSADESACQTARTPC